MSSSATMGIVLLLAGGWLFAQVVMGGLVDRIRNYTDPSERNYAGGAPGSVVTGPIGGQRSRRRFVALLKSKKAADYEWGGTKPRTGVDCSGFIKWAMGQMGVPDFPRTSAEQIAHCKKISVQRAIHTVGAVLYRPGHIAVSQGNGKTIEARSEVLGVGEFSATEGRDWTAGGLIPELV